jgi:hypothetical protein
MTAEQARLDAASREALARRARLKAGTEAIKARLMPARLISDGKQHVTAQAKLVVADSKARVRAHPVVTATIVTGLLAWIFRKPLLRYAPPMLSRGYDWLAGKLPFSQISAYEQHMDQSDDEDVDSNVASPLDSDDDDQPDDEPGEDMGDEPDHART